MQAILDWVLRAALIALGAGAVLWLVAWVRGAWRSQERWPVRIAFGLLLLAVAYTIGHVRLLAQRESIEEGRAAYARFGDPRRTEARRAEIRGWMLDCTGEPGNALALYRERDGRVQRTYPLGESGANFIGGGEGAEERDFTMEILFSPELRQPRGLMEAGQLHPAGTDVRFTLCSDLTGRAGRLLRESGRQGAVIVQDVSTGAIAAYAATGGKDDPPLGIKRYAPPGSVFKLALAALWWEQGLPDDMPIPCPASIEITDRATISNAGRVDRGTVIGPAGMLVPSCNTSAVWMAQHMREQFGEQPFADAYRAYGFEPYETTAPRDTSDAFWSSDSRAWSRRMAPPPARIRISENTGPAEWAQLSIGQGPVDVTVISISRFVQAIGNDGVMLPPTIEWDRTTGRLSGDRVMRPETARRLQEAMRRVVTSGTARSVGGRMSGVPWEMGGKTGTAQVAGASDDGWFAGLVHDEDGRARYSVVVYLRGGGPGGGRPAAIAAELGRALAQGEGAPEADE